MNKAQLVDRIAERNPLTKKDISSVLTDLTAVMAEALIAGEAVGLTGIGSLRASTRAARVGRNPNTGKLMTIPASRSIRFTISQNLKDDLQD